mmetsp:Transcript_29892/g.77155  ORF Transcript_29892/g.77155 Transcript_29892/m.77155 type:complete len:105 (+) Transcript_29892:188-502(+)
MKIALFIVAALSLVCAARSLTCYNGQPQVALPCNGLCTTVDFGSGPIPGCYTGSTCPSTQTCCNTDLCNDVNNSGNGALPSFSASMGLTISAAAVSVLAIVGFF